MKFKSSYIKKPKKTSSYTEYTAETFSLKMEAFSLDEDPSSTNFQILIREMKDDRLFFMDSETTLDKCRKKIDAEIRKYLQVLEFLNKIENE
jgi:hypothetical protein